VINAREQYSLVFFVEFVRAVLVFGGALWTLRENFFCIVCTVLNLLTYLHIF